MSSEVRLSTDIDDFISPSLACTIKPMQIDRAKPNRVLRLEGIDDAEDEAAKPVVARVTLNDCLACSGCVTSAETVLITQQSMAELLRSIRSPSQLVVLSVSPAARAALAVHSRLGLLEAFERLTGLFKALGCHHVFDCGLASDLCLVQMAAEFINRFRQHSGRIKSKGTSGTDTNGATGSEALPLPVLSSSCPGWICYAEKTQQAVLPHLSRVKSPQQIAGSLVKYVHAHAAGLPPERVYHATLMPCYDKKLEASRDDFFNPDAGENGTRDVDCVISSTEVLQLLEERSQQLADIDRSPLDADPPFSSLSHNGRAFCVAAPGASGGGAEYVFRSAVAELFGVQLPPGALAWTTGRNKDIRELSFTVDGETKLRFAQAYGFRNIQNIVRRVKSGTCQYHYVELMACPGGCANGGGQPRPPALEAPQRTSAVEEMYISSADTTARRPEDNPRLQALYREGGFLEGGPLAEGAQRLLCTMYHARADTMSGSGTSSSLAIKW